VCSAAKHWHITAKNVIVCVCWKGGGGRGKTCCILTILSDRKILGMGSATILNLKISFPEFGGRFPEGRGGGGGKVGGWGGGVGGGGGLACFTTTTL
jgi:hypothetical protein